MKFSALFLGTLALFSTVFSGCGSIQTREVKSWVSNAAPVEVRECAVKLTTPQLVTKLGEVRGTLGCPVTGEESDIFGEGLYVTLENGGLFWRSKTKKAYALHGKILEKFWELGGPGYQLGYPTSDIAAIIYSQGLVARFDKGAISVLPGKDPSVTILVPGVTWR
jgi:uncharacterized protein with LGFP repeats